MHRWHRDYNRAARPPPDIIKGAQDVLISWFWLAVIALVIGALAMVFGLSDDMPD